MTDYALLLQQLKAFAETDADYLPLLSNASSLVYHAMEDVNWAGFYLYYNGHLVLGPFQGNPACIHIEDGKGVCGTAVVRDEDMQVGDVHKFPGHIACDAASRSEVVLPIHVGGQIIGVLDIDSPVTERFTDEDMKGLRQVRDLIESVIQIKEIFIGKELSGDEIIFP